MTPRTPPMMPSVIRKTELAEIPSIALLMPMYFRISPLTPKHEDARIAKSYLKLLTEHD